MVIMRSRVDGSRVGEYLRTTAEGYFSLLSQLRARGDGWLYWSEAA